MKYDCPPPSKFGKDLPLWKSATTNFLRVVKECLVQMNTLKSGRRISFLPLTHATQAVFRYPR